MIQLLSETEMVKTHRKLKKKAFKKEAKKNYDDKIYFNSSTCESRHARRLGFEALSKKIQVVAQH